MYGLTRWQPWGGRGGNVKYKIAVCFISKSDLMRLTPGAGHRFDVMGVRHSGREFSADKVRISDNLRSVLGNQGAGVSPNSSTPLAAKYAALGGMRGFLGAPVHGIPGVDELIPPDQIGRLVGFQYGAIYWSPSTGAFEVHGAIREKWASLGYERSFLGYPITDELVTPDRVGRFNHFQYGSIYWTPQTGAHEVHGDIRAKWASMGWERSFLGYPTSDELNASDGRGKVSRFQGGYIEWYPGQGATVYRQ